MIVELCTVVLALSVAWIALLVAASVPPLPPLGGWRGACRQRARQRWWMRWADPLLRLIARPLAPLVEGRWPRLRLWLEARLVRAGEWLGLRPCEFLAQGPLLLLIFALLCWLLDYRIDDSTWLLSTVAVPVLLMILLERKGRQRIQRIERALPGAVDLAALCMGAGLDFPGALRKVVDSSTDARAPVTVELSLVLAALQLGQTREAALRRFEDRVQCDAVSEMVAAVIQSEVQGSPLIDVLNGQAQRLRERRTVLAEEAAARAGVMLLVPMLMVMASVALVLVAPLIVQLVRGGLM